MEKKEGKMQIEDQKQKPKSTLRNFITKQKDTFPLKIVILCYSGGAVCIFPFLVLQMQKIGLTINEIGVLYLIIPFGALLGPIISGMIADKIGQYKLIFMVCAIMGALSCNILLIIPKYEQNKIYLNCDLGQMSVNYSDCNECISNLNYKTSQTFNLKNCQPCNGNENVEFNCTGNSFENFVCPVFNTSKDIEITLSLSEQNSSCVRMVNNYTQPDTANIEEKERCSKRESCDYKCDIPDSVSECFHQALLSDTFIYSAIASFLGNFFVSSSFIMLDATILRYVKEHNASIGKQKIMSMFGFAFAPLLAGYLIDSYSQKKGYKSYLPAFIMSDVLMGAACLFAYKVKMTADKNTSNIFRDLGKLVTALEVDLFLLLVLVLGCNFGFIETYLFIYLQSLGAPTFLLGLTMTVGCLSSIPMLFCADWIDKKIGRHKIFVICFTAYAIRMIGYSFIRNPWMCLIFECFESITYQLMWVTCLKLCPLLAPKGMLATMTGLAGSIHYSFGKGIGGFLGGHLIESIWNEDFL
ncbi:Major facilitator superfamily domain-containing protein 6 [Armadillidium nasatum]|uniref:Major facilitator superfamily domain-containing protein 6 n=1 Tax=Armadillidium nasatum TaxID=96803 RepID=A0A5N5TBH0_9CRUS|nr:Major facilitator superfamily domain-containing protein 6 [Armadillidium nasatum]